MPRDRFPARRTEPPLTFIQFLSILWRRKLTIAVCVVVAVAGALAYSKFRKPSYQSTALVQVSSSASSAAASGQATGNAPINLPNPAQQINSTAVQIDAARIMKDPSPSSLASQVSATVGATGGTLTITATAGDPHQAQAIASAFAQAYIDQTQTYVQAQVNKIGTAITSIGQQITQLQSQVVSPVTTAKIQGLTAALGTLQTQQANIQFGGPYASIQVAADLPTAPSGLSKAKLGAIGIVAGLLVGIGIALGREQLDTRLRTSPEIEEITDSPVLAELPQDQDVRTGKVSIALVQAPHSQMSEAIRELRTSLRVLLDGQQCPLIVVTSPEAGDGKTFVAANLAAAWAMSGSKVIAVSADFRRPHLEELFGLEAEGLPGLSDLILSNWKEPDINGGGPGRGERPMAHRLSTGERDTGGRAAQPSKTALPRNGKDQGNQSEKLAVGSVLRDSGIYGLRVLSAGTRLDNPSELFGSPGMQPVLDQLAVLADVVIFDTPPVLAVPDTAIVGGASNGAVVVASEGRTERIDLERTIRRLDTTHCNVLGVTVNGARRSTAENYPSYAYRR
ncbi:MAG: Wzz/FepE/Etk N-terminal domain-containing protein [Acidimicrobiales bacterium]